MILLQAPHVAFPAVELLGDVEAVRHIALPQGEGAYLAAGGQLAAAALQILDEAVGPQVAVLGRLRQKPQDDVGDGRRQIGPQATNGRRGHGEVVVDELEGIADREGRLAGQQLVEGGPQGIEVGSPVQVAVHAPGLLGSDVRQGSLQGPKGAGPHPLFVQARGQVEVDELQAPGLGVGDEVRGVDILVDQALAVDAPQHARHLDGQLQEALRPQPSVIREGVQRGGVDVLQHQHQVVAHRQELDGPDHPGIVHEAQDVVLQAQPGAIFRRRVIAAQGLEDDGLPVPQAPRTEDPRGAALVDGLQITIAWKHQESLPSPL